MTKRNRTRKKTPRDAEMSKLMKQIRTANPSLAQHQVLSMASKQLSRKSMGSGLFLEPYRKRSMKYTFNFASLFLYKWRLRTRNSRRITIYRYISHVIDFLTTFQDGRRILEETEQNSIDKLLRSLHYVERYV